MAPARDKTFQQVLADAIEDIVEHGYDSEERIESWSRALRTAAEGSLITPASLELMLRDTLAMQYRRYVDEGGVLRHAPGVERFTLERIKPRLRGELDRRIAASASLIKLNRAEAIEKTMRRFRGWSTSVPPGGVSAEKKKSVKVEVRKGLRQLPFEERRVLIDQGHKLIASISDIVASDGGAIAGTWRSNWRQPGYDYREDHRERDGLIYLIRDSWAHKAGLVKPGKAGYSDQVTAPAQEPFCRCYYKWLFNLRDLPDDMLTAKGRATLAFVQPGSQAARADDQGARADDAAAGMAHVRQLDRLGWLAGLTGVRQAADADAWHAAYDDGPDTITLERKFFDLSAGEQLHVFLHETGHRGQTVAPELFAEFKRRHLDRLESFREIANPVHLDDFMRRGFVDGGLADEVFAESYSRAVLGLELPAELAAFWAPQLERAGLMSQRQARYTPVWPNRITRCQRCTMFMRVAPTASDNACTAVAGKISAHGHCRIFAIIGARAA